jgi:hypothetical protein
VGVWMGATGGVDAGAAGWGEGGVEAAGGATTAVRAAMAAADGITMADDGNMAAA